VTTQDPTSKLNLQEDGVQLLLNRVNEAEKCGMWPPKIRHWIRKNCQRSMILNSRSKRKPS